MRTKTDFEPLLVAFLCHWCAYTGADFAGSAGIKYPASVRIVRVMCTGRVDPLFVLKAFREGADGVLVSGCHPGDCHYVDGNIKAMRREPLLAAMLEQLGIERERFQLVWVSASEGEKFARVVTEMTDTLRELGPLNLKGGEQLG
ncbi:MAG: hydrogenase iron-sulfur subunit [Thermoanaerobacteraceae bacterium]|nr:hydrogenase iron-sulfur subunit [Thermoanaerobacteraceae bacterium]